MVLADRPPTRAVEVGLGARRVRRAARARHGQGAPAAVAPSEAPQDRAVGDREPHHDQPTAARIGALVVAFVLWWMYFDFHAERMLSRLKEAAQARGRLGRDLSD